MTHEPDIIREAERVLREAQPSRDWCTSRPLAGLDNPSTLFGLPVRYPIHPDFPSDEVWMVHDGHVLGRFAFDPYAVRVAADEQRDYGDEHKERA